MKTTPNPDGTFTHSMSREEMGSWIARERLDGTTVNTLVFPGSGPVVDVPQLKFHLRVSAPVYETHLTILARQKGVVIRRPIPFEQQVYGVQLIASPCRAAGRRARVFGFGVYVMPSDRGHVGHLIAVAREKLIGEVWRAAVAEGDSVEFLP